MRSITASRAEAFPIGQLARRSGVKIETIRYYERVKMLIAPPRTAAVACMTWPTCVPWSS
jgi:MerR family transcriptional regulator, mercuric resistance operon regulatory protein